MVSRFTQCALACTNGSGLSFRAIRLERLQGTAGHHRRRVGPVAQERAPTGPLFEIERLAPDINYTVSLEKEVGANQPAELVSEVFGAFWQTRHTNQRRSERVFAQIKFRRDGDTDRAFFRVNSFGIDRCPDYGDPVLPGDL